MTVRSKPQAKTHTKCFFCPLGHSILWWHGLEYKECPLVPAHRDMPECKDCRLRIDKEWESSKETWQDKPIKKKKRKRYGKNRKKKQGVKK